MIEIHIYRNKNNEIYCFTAKNHTKDIVCSAVSILTLNTVNAIESYTDEEFSCEFDEKGGYLNFSCPFIKENKHNHDVNLLLNTMLLGLNGIKEQYFNKINIIDKGGTVKC